MNTKLNEYLRYQRIRIIDKTGDCFEGHPLAIEYGDENDCGEDVIDLEIGRDGPIYGFTRSEIQRIDIL